MMETVATWPQTKETDMLAVATVVYDLLQTAATSDAGAQVLTLAGDLGAGKTTFTKILAAELGVTETVTSPTFVIMKTYTTTNPQFTELVHIDAYRLDDETELSVLGWEALLRTPNTLILLEWPSRVPGLLPDNHYTLTFESTHDTRDITLTYGS